MQRSKPPFRADHVGSLLRPPALKAAREQRERGEITPGATQGGGRSRDQTSDQKAGRDRDFRRSPTASSGAPTGTSIFSRTSTGCEGYWMEPQTSDPRQSFKGAVLRPWMVRVIGKSDFPATHPHIEHFKFLKANTSTHAEGHDPVGEHVELPGRSQSREREGLPQPRQLLCRPRADLWQGDQGVLRRRLPLPADRRRGVCVFLRQRPAADAARPRR